MKIAVCDDEKVIAEQFCEKVLAQAPDSEISVFTNGDDLIRSGEVYDAAFLDIEMEGLNGFQTAKTLSVRQPQCVFSFITTHAELAVDGYDYQPFRYILKTAPESVINRKIKETLNEALKKNKYLLVSYKRKSSSILIDSIFYIEIEGHCMKIVLKDKDILCGKTLEKLENDIKNYGLVRCHRSFMVSLSKIKEITSQDIIMENECVVPIGRKYKKHFLEEYNNFIMAN